MGMRPTQNWWGYHDKCGVSWRWDDFLSTCMGYPKTATRKGSTDPQCQTKPLLVEFAIDPVWSHLWMRISYIDISIISIYYTRNTIIWCVSQRIQSYIELLLSKDVGKQSFELWMKCNAVTIHHTTTYHTTIHHTTIHNTTIHHITIHHITTHHITQQYIT